MVAVAKKATVSVEKSNAVGMEARGAGIAENLLKAVKDQSGALLRYLVDIATLDQHGRTSFRVNITKRLNELRKFIKEQPDGPDKTLNQKILRSSTARVSEAMTFSKAIDNGFNFEPVKTDYHKAIVLAREFQRARGAGDGRGRPKVEKSALVKVKDYLNKMIDAGELKQEDMPGIIEMMQYFQKTKWADNNPAPAAATTEEQQPAPAKGVKAKRQPKPKEEIKGGVPVQHVGPTVRHDRRKKNEGAMLGIERRTHNAPSVTQ